MLRNWILQDLPHVFTQRSLKTIETASFSTATTKNRKFWSLFEFSRKDNRKDAKKLSQQGDSLKTPKNNRLNDSSKSTFTMKSSNKVYPTGQASNDYTFRYIPRIKPKCKTSRTNINKPDELTSLLDGNLVPTNMKLKLKGYKTLRNAQAKDFAFVPGGKCFELDILPDQNEDGSMGVCYKLSERIIPKKVEKLRKLPPQETTYNELESNYVPFPIPISDYSSYTEDKVSANQSNTEDSKKIVKKETNASHPNPVKNILKHSETRAVTKNDTPIEQKRNLTQSHDQDQLQVRLENEQEEFEKSTTSQDKNSEVQQSRNNLKQESQSLSQKNIQSTKSSSSQSQIEPSPLASLHQPNLQHNLSESRDTVKVNRLTSSNMAPDQTDPIKTSHDQSADSSIKNIDKANPGEAMESEIKSNEKVLGYGMYESRMEQQRRASSPCSTSFVKARENSTKQRWSGFDRPATGCTPGSPASHGTRSQGSTRPYTPTVPTREASSKCYARGRDPIVRSDIASKSCKMVKTRNSVTAASIATVNFAEASPRVKGERILLGSKSATGLGKISQTVAYGSCNKSNSNCNEKNSCSKKRRLDCEDEEMIPGRVICTRPRRRNDCSRPKPCRVEKSCEKKFTCVEKLPPPRPSCCKPKKKKKVCKRYCCPSLKADDCLLRKNPCPPKRGKKCSNKNEDDDDYDRPVIEDPYHRVIPTKDTTCLPMDNCLKQAKNTCNDSEAAVRHDSCGPIRELCTHPRRCNKSRNSNRDDRDDDCLENEQEYREICTKPKKKDCCNSRRSSKRSNSCGHRRYHSETKPLRNSKSSVTIPMFDVSVVSLRPYQNDAVLRFYSCGSKPPVCGEKEDPCKKKCQKPEPKCLNKPKSASICGQVEEDNCSKMMKQKEDPCAKQKESICGKPKVDPCGSSKDTKEADQERLQRELQEMQKCKNIQKKCNNTPEKKKKTGLERVVSPCKRDQKQKGKCDKFASIEDLKVLNVGLPASHAQLGDPMIGFWMRRECYSSLLNFGMKPDNIVNRSFCTSRKTDRRYENTLQYGDNMDLSASVEPEAHEIEWDEESSSSEM